MRLGALVVICLLAYGDPSQADILEVLSAKESMAGQFTQRIISPEGLPLETASGRFMLLRPDSLKWEIDSPDRQTLLSTGNQLTQIDWDLEVVVEREISPDQWGPFQWLLASREELASAFDLVTEQTRLVLTPKQPGGSFKQVEITNGEAGVWQLVVIDLGDQRIDFTLSEASGGILKPSDFQMPAIPF